MKEKKIAYSVGEITVENSPGMIYRDIGDSMKDYAMTLIDDEQLSEQENFPSDCFIVMEPMKCVHTILKFYTNKDYSDFNRVRHTS